MTAPLPSISEDTFLASCGYDGAAKRGWLARYLAMMNRTGAAGRGYAARTIEQARAADAAAPRKVAFAQAYAEWAASSKRHWPGGQP